MSGDFTYFRKYIILKDDYINISNINPKGYGKIEGRGTKGTIRINIENCENEKDYRVYFLERRDNKVEELDLGRIITDERGRAKTNINFNLRELETKGFPIKKVDAILIRRDIYVLLGGYIDKDNGAIDKYIERLMQEKAEDSSYGEYESGDSNEDDLNIEAEETQDEIIEEIEEIEEVEEIEEESEELEDPKVETEELEDSREETQEVEGVEETIEEIEEPEQVPPTDYSQPSQTYESLEYMRRSNHKKQMTNYIMSVLRFFPRLQPLKIYLHGYRWWRIDEDGSGSHRGFLPYYNYLMSANYKYPFLYNSTTCMNQISRYGHYLFGIYEERNEIKYYVYGIPGRFTTKEHPFKGVTGFNTWYDSIDGVGYWVLYIDPMTGKVIYPINPMIPTDEIARP